LCIAAVSRKGGFTESELKAFFRQNADGGGFTWSENGKLFVHRHIRNENEFVNTGKRLAKFKNLVTHCRIRTMGDVSVDNAHPFPIRDKEGLAIATVVHNGQFYYTYQEDKDNKSKYSDTRSLVEGAEDLLSDQELMSKKEVIKDIEIAVGYNNKMIVLYPNAEFVIVNELAGTWVGEKWYSNMNWRGLELSIKAIQDNAQ
jgi:predicted glutamine amidotransferase